MDYAERTLNKILIGGDLTKVIKERNNKYFSENQILDWFT
jgi:hypothetical protein